jgi:hypothetical protein
MPPGTNLFKQLVKAVTKTYHRLSAGANQNASARFANQRIMIFGFWFWFLLNSRFQIPNFGFVSCSIPTAIATLSTFALQEHYRNFVAIG